MNQADRDYVCYSLCSLGRLHKLAVLNWNVTFQGLNIVIITLRQNEYPRTKRPRSESIVEKQEDVPAIALALVPNWFA